MVKTKKSKVVLKPVTTWRELFGSIPGLSAKKFLKLRAEEASYESGVF